MTPKPPRLDLNPSSADRWTTCTASPRFILDNSSLLPADTGSRFSREGTTAHEVAAATLLGREPIPENCPTEIDGDMRWHGWMYAEYVTGLRKAGSKLLVEQKLPLWYMPGRNAIVDAGVVNPDDGHIADLKYGEGVPVSPVRNLQEVIYAWSIFGNMILPDEFPITLHIYQPRGRDAANGPAHVWQTKFGELREMAHAINATAKNIMEEGEVAFAPSEKACQWCPAKGICVARQRMLTEDIEVLSPIGEKELPLATVLTIEQISTILTHKDQIEKWLKGVEEYALERMKNGNAIPGHKLVLGRGGNRYWTNPKKAAELLLKETVLRREEVIEESTISPSAVEKKLGKHKWTADLLNLIGKPAGKPVIAPADDSREEIGADVTAEIEALPV